MLASTLQQTLKKVANPRRAREQERFFKTKKGEYAAGDRFYGIPVPVTRRIIRDFYALAEAELEKLLLSKMHEDRLAALLIMVYQYERGASAQKKSVYNLYVRLRHQINNWDLVDCSAHKIVGDHLSGKGKKTVLQWAQSDNLWDRRIAMIAMFYEIRNEDFRDALTIATLLLHDEHDLIHKAVGWMLREIGNRNRAIEKSFLDQHAHTMPRTMLRYAIEKFPPSERHYYRTKTA